LLIPAGKKKSAPQNVTRIYSDKYGS